MNYKIKTPFAYFGSKDRFYKEIREIFINNKRDKFVDLFAGACSIPLSLKNEFKELEVLVNVKDEKMEAFLNYADVPALLKKGLDFLTDGKLDFENVRDLYKNNRARFEELNKKFKELWGTPCPCCGKMIKRAKDKKTNFTEQEKIILAVFFGFGGFSKGSLSNAFYSKEKTETINKYLEMLKSITITTNYFDETLEFENSFIFLDPPYIQKIKADEDSNFVGYDYARDNGVAWGLKDDTRLIEFIKRNIDKNNVFLVFGSIGNNLSKLLSENFDCEFRTKEYTKNTFGNVSKRAEYFCLIK